MTTTTEATIREWVRVVEAEYRESPGLRLTCPQVQRFWGIDAPTCRAVLRHLEAKRFLKRTTGERYARADVW